MKLLLDENLSPRLCGHLADLGDTIVHVRDVGLASSDDTQIWGHAAEHRFMIVTKDTDFNNRVFVFGPPPKVVWIRRGNCSTRDIETLLRGQHAELARFETDEESALLILE